MTLAHSPAVHVDDLPTAALNLEADALQHNLATMASAHVDPTTVVDATGWLVCGDDVLEPRASDLRGWDW